MQNLLTDLLQNSLGDDFAQKASQMTGVSPQQSKTAIETALPFLLGGLSKNASSPQGAESLQNALGKKHSGDILSHIEDAFSGEAKTDGAGILNHILGQKQNGLQQYIGKKTGMDASQSSDLLQSLAPALMGALGKAQSQNSGDVSSLLQDAVKQFSGSKGGVSSSLITKFLDSDGDGSIADDIFSMILGMLKKSFFGK